VFSLGNRVTLWMRHTCNGNAFFTFFQTSEDVPKRIFKTIKDLIYAYEKPNQGLIVNLRHPVRRPKPPRRRVRNSKVEVNEDYDEIEDTDYVDVLP
ncbi:SH2 domain containing 1B, partial [Chelydra serpentina]